MIRRSHKDQQNQPIREEEDVLVGVVNAQKNVVHVVVVKNIEHVKEERKQKVAVEENLAEKPAKNPAENLAEEDNSIFN